MTQRRKIALAYAFAVPLVLVIVFVQFWALSGVKKVETGMAQTAGALRQADTAIALLTRAAEDTQLYLSNRRQESKSAFQDRVERLRGVLDQLRQLARSEPSLQPEIQALESSTLKRVGLLQQGINLNKDASSEDKDRTAREAQGRELMERIGKSHADLRAAILLRLEQYKTEANQSVRSASGYITIGGFLLIWLVGVAAFLLFHDEKARTWEGKERRVHTKILQTLPLGVCLTNELGSILYANPAEEALFGFDEGEMIIKDANRLHPPDDQAASSAAQPLFSRLQSSDGWSGEHSIRKKDGTISKIFLWILNLETPGQLYRLIIHAPQEGFMLREKP